MPLNLDSLALLELIESRGSFAAAATALNRAPSAITYQLRQLEESLDLLIYDRTGHRAKLTPAGQVLLDEGRRLLQASETVRKRVKAVASGWEPELRIVLDALIPFESLTPAIAAFHTLKVPTQLRFTGEVLSGTWEALHADRADLLIGSQVQQSHFASSTGLHVHPLGHTEFVFAVAPSHPLAQADEPLCNEQISAHRAVAVGDTSRQFKPLTFGLQDGQAVLTVPTLQAKIQAQAAGLGCGWLPVYLAQPFIDRGQLVTKEVEEVNRTTALCLAWQKGRQGQALQWWAQYFEDHTLELNG